MGPAYWAGFHVFLGVLLLVVDGTDDRFWCLAGEIRRISPLQVPRGILVRSCSRRSIWCRVHCNVLHCGQQGLIDAMRLVVQLFAPADVVAVASMRQRWTSSVLVDKSSQQDASEAAASA